ncbi:hypothetical protein TWF481_001875 [Arthrobotrys musiformis]|uniref:Uncharacterized protein n=1 Tax=Arthrobotrys musiformis TaxID=47236 RepID=A0AAV9VUK2_9PEZI
MLQKLSRESLRLNPQPDPRANGQIIYETSKQVKKAYNKRKGTSISEAEKKRIERIRVLDERAEKIKQKEQRKKENALKRKAKEEKEGPTFKKIARITSSQPELINFFAVKKPVSGPAKKVVDYSLDVAPEDPQSETEDSGEIAGEIAGVQAIDPESDVDEKEDRCAGAGEDEDGHVTVEAKIKSGALAEVPIDDSDIQPASPTPVTRPSPTLVGEPGNGELSLGQKATMKLCSQLFLSNPDEDSERLDGGMLVAGGLLGDARLLPSSSNDIHGTLPRGILDSSPPLPVYARDIPPESEEEEAEAKREEDERILEILREETDYNDFDDDYYLNDDPGFDYDYAEGPTSPVHEVGDETYGDEGLDIAASDEAYGMGLSDPEFDELHDAFGEHEVEEARAEDFEQEFDSSFLCQEFEDDMRELEEDGF